MKKVLGIIALVAICACSEKPKEATHPELSELNLWNCIDALEYEYIMLNESGEPLPQITRYAWADIDGDGMAELFLGSKEGEAPEISAAFALGGKEPGLIGFADPSHSMYFYPEGVSTCGTGTSRYNYMDRRFRLQDSKIEWELTMEETKEMYQEDEIDLGGNYIWYAETTETREPSPKELEARLAEFTEQYELVPAWQPLDGLYEMAEYKYEDVTVKYNANRYEIAEKEEVGTDFTLRLQNPREPEEWISFNCYYDDGMDVMQENGNAELIAERLKGTCEENSLNISEDDEYEIYDSYVSSIEYYHPENGYFYNYEAGHNGKQLHGAIAVKPAGSGKILVMRSQSPSFHTAERIMEQFPSLNFER
ncbi:MAG: hypothetical protein J6X25_00295 [Bacteroidales bacterium]|nr:hypothetical protein [Bacteroidales bacterium]